MCSKATALNKQAKLLGTARDTKEFRAKVKAGIDDTKRSIQQLKRQLQSLHAQRSLSEDDRFRIPGLQRSVDDAGKRYLKAVQEWLTAEQRHRAAEGRAVERERERRSSAEAGSLAAGGGTELEMSQLQSGALVNSEVEVRAAIMEEKAAEALEIQRAAEDLREMFQDVSNLVDEQQAGIDDIEANVESAAASVKKGTADLEDAAESQKKYRRRQCILLVIVVVVIAVILLSSGVIDGI